MGEPRIFVDPGSVRGNAVVFSAEGLRHVRRVLRLRHGDLLRATDGRDREFLVRLVLGDAGLEGRIVESSRPARESPLRTVLAQALPRGGRMEHVLQKAVELGVREIQPVVTTRSVVSAPEERAGRRQERWQRIIEAAVAQSGRTQAPVLHRSRTWEEFLGTGVKADLRIILRERNGEGLREAIPRGPSPASVVVAVGPEGGWSGEEVEAALQAGFKPVGLGPRILRTETAGLVALSILQFLCGDLR